jgi:hypothetical protein
LVIVELCEVTTKALGACYFKGGRSWREEDRRRVSTNLFQLGEPAQTALENAEDVMAQVLLLFAEMVPGALCTICSSLIAQPSRREYEVCGCLHHESILGGRSGIQSAIVIAADEMSL